MYNSTPSRLFGNAFNIKKALLVISAAIAVSTAGYMIIEDASLIDSFFMTVITLSTVGYSEVFPLSDAGRLFSSLMILLNIIILAYTISSLTEYLLDGNLFKQRNRKRMENRIKQLSNHIIICGYSKYAEESLLHFNHQNQSVLLIDREEEKVKLFHERHPNDLYIQADASDDNILELAQIGKAKAILSTMADRSENIFITLTARELNPNVKIVARTADDRTEHKLRKAGADHIIMPERMGGFYMATVVNKPGTVDFFDQITNEWQSEVHIEEIGYDKLKAEFKNASLGALAIQERTGANVIGFKDREGKYIVNPEMKIILDEGSSLVAMGTLEQINAMVKHCS